MTTRPAAQAPAAARVSPTRSPARTALLTGILVTACALAYHNSLEGPFIFDDHQSVEENPHAHRLWPLTYSMRAPLASGVAGRPVVSLSIAINYAIGGLDVTGYHLANALFHVASVLLLFGIARRTFQVVSDNRASSEGSPGLKARAFGGNTDSVALSIALLWSVHPLLTESVTYIIQRTELLMGLFFLATLYCFIRGATSASSRARAGWYATSVIACALGMGSKEVMVTAPVIVLVYDRLFLAGSFRAALRTRWRFYVLLGLTLAIVPILLMTSVAFVSKSGGGFERLTVWQNLLTQSGVIVHYLRLALWPSKLVIDYDDWPIAHSPVEVLPQALLIVALLVLSAYGLWRGYRLAFLGAWFFVILAPTSSFLPLGTEIAGERRMYLPMIAIVTLVVLGGRFALTQLSGRFAWRPSSVRLSGALAVIILAGAMIATTVNRNEDYRTAVSIYGDAAAKRPNNARARLNLGVALYKLGQVEPARQAIQQALDLKPNYPDAHYYMGIIVLGDTKPDRAALHFALAQKGRPHWPLPYVRLGELLEAKDAEQARKMYEVARKIAAGAGQGVLVAEIDAKLAALANRGPA